MTLQTIAEAWHSSFGPAMPVGYLCRTTLPDRWMRIHSLPGSKRYPDSEAERDEVLRRQNDVACYVLGEGSECILFITQYGESRYWPDYYLERSRYTAEFLELNRFAPEYVQSYDKGLNGPLQIFATHQRWHAGAFDSLILMCADGTGGPYLFANIDRRSAFAPYDGGADLFFSTSDAVVEARRTFSDWLSAIESGL
ncbi:MAG: hypothetical protein K2Y28_00815 [Burkholderiaceae bacterium]|nr:hypothetical protein [Burkholderiaceae bacterium]